MKKKSRATWLLAVLAVLALFVAACGDDGSDEGSDDTTSTTAASGAGGGNAALLEKATAKLNGQGSSFQDTFQQKVSSDFGLGRQGRRWLGHRSPTRRPVRRTAARPSPTRPSTSPAPTRAIKDEEKASFGDRKILYFPIIGGPIAVAYNLEGVDALNLDADTIAKIFQAEITTWDDPAIKADNPDADLPSTPDHGRAPLGRLRHDQQLHQVPGRRRARHLEARQR